MPVTAPAITSPAPRPIAFNVDGYADVRTGIRGRVTIAGTFNGTYDATTHAVTGAFSLTPTPAHVSVLGLLPVVAETDWLFPGPVTGAWQDGVLSLHVAARIRHPRMTMFGLYVAGGPNCATTTPSEIDLRAPVPAGEDGLPTAGALTTSGAGFRISALADCGPLTPLLSAVAAGGGNQAAVRLTPAATG